MNASNKLKTENEKLKTENSLFRFQFSVLTFQFFRRGPVQVASILAIALVLKYHYSVATVNGLRWILAPTTFLVETITGRGFSFESQAGYMSSDHTFLIAASCSGLNFMIIAFVMLMLGAVRHEWPRPIEWRVFPLALIAAFVATILANTVRIIIALQIVGMETAWVESEELHRLEGIVVYFVSLLLLFLASERFRSGVRLSRHQLIAGSKYLLIVYYAVTLGIPILRGSYRSSEFWEHSIWVIVVPLVILIPAMIMFTKTRKLPNTGN